MRIREKTVPENAASEFGARLREERKKRGLTQAQVAAAAGISPPTQIGYEQGHRTPDANYMTDIERLGIDECYVRTGVRAPRAAVSDMDWAFFLDVQAAGEAWFQRELGITLDASERNEIARLLYEMLINEREVRPTDVARILQLVVVRR